ncbi:Cell division protein FtsA [wastewater metagenome]|uniref:Cell division protein FtsA n=2 Tax=unclassified sequences TaxID=12908 RepID=A0A5B8RCA5_9ZZZZ|nr:MULTISPECIES: pilus assembly protein PilM [Arhodomonas]QEA05032.1 cell division protein FtsA [uncultured organism]
MALFRKKSSPLLGLDISSSAIKLIELSRQGRGYRVESYAVEPLPQNAVVEKNITDLEAVSRAIKGAVKRSRTKLHDAAVAVPGSSAISRILTLPKSASDEDIESQVNLQAEQYVPYPLEEVDLDFEVLGPARQGGDDEIEVLLVASRSENVEIRVDALESAGIKPKVVDVESFAVERACEPIIQSLEGEGEQTIAVMDIGATMSTLTVLEGERITYTRDQVFGGRQLTEEIMRRFDMSYAEAGRAKRQGGLGDEYEHEVLAPFREAMVQQITRSLQFFYGAGQQGSVDHVLLAGGCASIPGVAEEAEREVGIPVHVANPFASMSAASRVGKDALTEDAPALLIACGLAMRSFD